ncbi:MAG: CHAT domain-containing protein [Chitinophagales bacterium]
MSKDTLVLKTNSSLKAAKTAYAQRDYEKVVELLENLLPILEENEAWSGFMEMTYLLANSYVKVANPFAATKIIEAALVIHSEKCPKLISSKVQLYAAKVEVCLAQGKMREVLYFLDESESLILEHQIEGRLRINHLLQQAQCQLLMIDYQKTRVFLGEAFDLLKNERNVYDTWMIYYLLRGLLETHEYNYSIAKQVFAEALEVVHSDDFEYQTNFLFLIGEVHGYLGNLKEELKNYNKAICLNKKKYQEGFPDRIKTEMGIFFSWGGYCLQKLGDSARATHYFENALVYYQQVAAKPETADGILPIYLSIAHIYGAQKKHRKQIEYLQRALTIEEEELGEKHTDTAMTYNNIGLCHLFLEEMDAALPYLEKALTLAKGINADAMYETGMCHNALGAFWSKKKEYIKANDYFSQSLRIYQNIYGKKHAKIGSNFLQLAKSLYLQGALRDSIEHCQLALTASIIDFNSRGIYDLPNVNQCFFIEGDFFLEVLIQKAKALYDYFHFLEKQENSETFKALTASLEACQLAANYLKLLQKTLKMEQSKLIFAEKMTPIYQLAMQTISLLVNCLQDKTVWERAFDFLELEKSFLLRSAMSESEAKFNTEIEPSLLEEEQGLRNQIGTYLQKIKIEEGKGEEKNELAIKEWKQTHFDYLQKHHQIIEKFEKDYPEYYRLKYDLQTANIEVLQAELEENTVVLNYFIGTEIGYVFAISRDEYQVVPVNIPADFEAQVQEYMESIHAQNFEKFAYHSYDLYCLLIQPVSDIIFDLFEENLKQLVVLPSACLHYLPFETLICQSVNENHSAFHELDYLLRYCDIQYHHSATLYLQYLQKKSEKSIVQIALREENSFDFIGFAPIYTSGEASTQEILRNLARDYEQWASRSEALRENDAFAPLPFTEKEVRNVANLFVEKGLKEQSFLYDSATKQHFKTFAPHAKYIHIAAHGLTNDQNPQLSGIVLHPNGDSKEMYDSVLSMGEMYQLRLEADLVVLSSCESGIGKLAKGEGMIAMNRGFLYAGAKNVIYTLFKVLDKPSSDLCELLFAEILEGKSYSEALRLAKLKLINRKDIDPKSWCGFVLLGV